MFSQIKKKFFLISCSFIFQNIKLTQKKKKCEGLFPIAVMIHTCVKAKEFSKVVFFFP